MSFDDFTRILRARFRLIATTLLIVVGATLTLSLLMREKYTAEASILVDYRGANPVSGNMLPIALFAGYLATQVDIIQSQSVALKVVDDLKLVEDAAARGRYLPPGFRLEPIDLVIGPVDRVIRKLKEWLPQSPRDEADRPDARRFRLADQLLSRLSVKPSQDSSVINLSYAAEDPEAAETATNAFVRAYIAKNLELDVKPAQQSSTWLDDQIKVLQDKLAKSQAELSAFQQKAGIIATDEHLDVETSRLADLSSQLVMAQSANHPAIEALKFELARAEAAVNALAPEMGVNHPQYKQARTEVNALRQTIAHETSAVVGQIQGRTEAQRSKVLQLKKQRGQGAILVNKVDNAQKAYDNAMQRYIQTRMESQIIQTNVSVISSAVAPNEPSSPKLALNLALAFFGGTVLAVGLALWREIANRPVRSVEDLRLTLGLPVLGVLPGASTRHGPVLAPAASYPQLTKKK